MLLQQKKKTTGEAVWTKPVILPFLGKPDIDRITEAKRVPTGIMCVGLVNWVQPFEETQLSLSRLCLEYVPILLLRLMKVYRFYSPLSHPRTSPQFVSFAEFFY